MELGIFIKSLSERNIELLGSLNCDFVVLDMEHTPLDLEKLYRLQLACEATNMSSVVRIPEITDYFIKSVLDLGVKRIQIPHINTANKLLDVRTKSMFFPEGKRGLCKYVRAAKYSVECVDDYIDRSNDEIERILQIEGKITQKELKNIIKNCKKNESIFLGPYDLSQSLGIPGKIWDDRVLEFMETVINECNKNNVKVGTFTSDTKGLEFWKTKGIDFLQYSSDLDLLKSSYNYLKTI
jgi:4-hydroxy-2-oxoheptanedioate aldolase